MSEPIDGGRKIHFSYNHEGLRTQKKVEYADKVVTADYLLHGKLVAHQTVTETDLSGNVLSVNEMHFVYDNDPRPAMVKFNGTMYFYRHNLQGDVVGIVDENGSPVVEYKYNAWGKLLPTTGTLKDTLGKLNLFRYRGYVYDEETKLYYLRNRYYNPEFQRFITADCFLAIHSNIAGTNLYLYCNNNPICCDDCNGNFISLNIDKYVHNAVLQDICSKNKNLSMKHTYIYYNGENRKGGFGFCDLYNIDTGEVWELKKDSYSFSCLTFCAMAQLSRYTSGRLKRYPDLKLRRPYLTVIPGGEFSCIGPDGNHYNVEYYTECIGILRYNYVSQEGSQTYEIVQDLSAAINIATLGATIIGAGALVGACLGGGLGAGVAALMVI